MDYRLERRQPAITFPCLVKRVAIDCCLDLVRSAGTIQTPQIPRPPETPDGLSRHRAGHHARATLGFAGPGPQECRVDVLQLIESLVPPLARESLVMRD